MNDLVLLSLTAPTLPPKTYLYGYLVPAEDASRHADASLTTDRSYFDSGISAMDDYFDLGPYGFWN